jgi:hypothetical protein
LTLYEHAPPDLDAEHERPDRPHVRSLFRSLDAPERVALYSIRDAPGALDAPPWAAAAEEEHTLMAVREFRRVPLDASGLRLVLFTARPGRAAVVIAALAHWVERAVSLYQPTYVLLAHSLEHPGLAALLAGVREGRALEWARSTPFSMDLVLPEIAAQLDRPPEEYVYCRPDADGDPLALTTEAVSPSAV